MLEDIKGVIFDLDGTLVDSMWMWKEIDIEFLDGYGYTLPDDLQRNVEGMSFDETANYFIQTFQLDLSVIEIQRIWNNMAREKYATQVPLKDGVLEVLKHLKVQNIPCGIASSNSKELIDIIVKKYNLKEYMGSVRNSNEVASGKPSPEIYQLVAKDLDVRPESCLVFEDVYHGVLGGKNANMKVCSVYDEYSSNDIRLLKRLADYHIKNYHEVINGEYEDLRYII